MYYNKYPIQGVIKLSKVDIKEIKVISEKETWVIFELETEERLFEGFIPFKNGMPLGVKLIGGGTLTASDQLKISVAAKKAIKNWK